MATFFTFYIIFVMAIGFWAGAWERNPFVWGGLAVIISPLGAAIFLVIAGRRRKSCPRCAEPIRLDALVCKHCGHELTVAEPAAVDEPAVAAQPKP